MPLIRKACLFEAPDISVYQGDVNMKAVRDAGAVHVGVRAGYGKNNIDQKWAKNALAMYNLNVRPLVYWFSYALNETMAKNEANFVCDAVEKYWKKAPIAYDLEYDTVNYASRNGVIINRTVATRFAIAFLKQVKARGHLPVLYTNRDYITRMFNIDTIEDQVGDFYIWYARYTNGSLTSDEEAKIDVWQYTSKGSYPGISGNVDLNRFYNAWPVKLMVEKNESSNVVNPNSNISDFQSAANSDGYRDNDGKILSVDGYDGPKTEQVKKKILIKYKLIGAKQHGSVVKWLQRRLNECMNAGLVVDGVYGVKTYTAVKNFQKKYNLAVDGIVGKETITSLFWN